jgi:hypothetical protein
MLFTVFSGIKSQLTSSIAIVLENVDTLQPSKDVTPNAPDVLPAPTEAK